MIRGWMASLKSLKQLYLKRRYLDYDKVAGQRKIGKKGEKENKLDYLVKN